MLATGAEPLQLTTSFRAPPSLQSFVNAAFAPAMTASPNASQAAYVSLQPSRLEIAGRPTVVALPVPRPYGDYGIGHQNVVSLLNANLKEEKTVDKQLTILAEGGVNRRASGRKSAARATSRGRSSAAKGITKRTAAIPSSSAKRKSAKRTRKSAR